MPEILTVLAVIAIMSAISIPYIFQYRKVYRSDDQALKIMDLMLEANQLALTRRRTIRFEIDLSDNTAKIIDENGTPANLLLKSIPLDKTSDVRVDVVPSGITRPNPPNYSDATYAIDGIGHNTGAGSVIGHTVWSARFRRDGSVVNASNNPLSVTLYVWPPVTGGSLTPRNAKEVRAITLFGGSAAIRFWKHNGSTFVAS